MKSSEEDHDRGDHPAVRAPLTRADLQHLPDDGHPYELIDGSLIVSPAPRHAHQVVLGNLYVLLRLACPPELQVVLAPSRWAWPMTPRCSPTC